MALGGCAQAESLTDYSIGKLCGLPSREGLFVTTCSRPSQRARGWCGPSEDNNMRSKKQTRSLLPGVRRLLKLLAEGHPLVLTVSPQREVSDERGVQPARN